MWGSKVTLQGHPAPGPSDNSFSVWDRASTHFLDSIGVPIVRGRNFTEQDTATSTPVVIVNQAFVRQFFPHEDPIGKRFGTGSPENSGAFQIVGVFADFKMTNPRAEERPLFFRALSQQYGGYKDPAADAAEKASMFVRFIILDFARPQPNVEALLRRTMAGIDPGLTIDHFSSYDSEVAANFNQERLIARLTSLFGILALILASVGLYGVMSYFVARRTGEIGIRMALGATRSGVVSLVLPWAFLPRYSPVT
jgi:hypothetical protein